MNMADSLGDLRQAVPDIALPRLDNNPARRLENRALPGIPFSIELELAGPERGVRFRQVRVAARTVVPVAAVDEDRDLATGVGDIRPTRRFAPVESIPA